MPKSSDHRVPIRTCVGCRRQRDQHELFRCTLGVDGVLSADRTAPGRGAWVCNRSCFDVARQRRAFDKAWRTSVQPSAMDLLAEQLTD